MYQISNIENMVDEAFRDLSRLAIGFEPTLRRLQVTQGQSQGGYPPFNLERVDDHRYRITLAVAGFTMDDLDITIEDNQLTISGDIRHKDDNRQYLHKGIASRSFGRSFVLADHVNVIGAYLENGILTVDLEHEIPEALKPRKIQITNKNVIDAKPVDIGGK